MRPKSGKISKTLSIVISSLIIGEPEESSISSSVSEFLEISGAPLLRAFLFLGFVSLATEIPVESLSSSNHHWNSTERGDLFFIEIVIADSVAFKIVPKSTSAFENSMFGKLTSAVKEMVSVLIKGYL